MAPANEHPRRSSWSHRRDAHRPARYGATAWMRTVRQRRASAASRRCSRTRRRSTCPCPSTTGVARAAGSRRLPFPRERSHTNAYSSSPPWPSSPRARSPASPPRRAASRRVPLRRARRLDPVLLRSSLDLGVRVDREARRSPHRGWPSTRRESSPRRRSGSHATARSRHGSEPPSSSWPDETVARLTELSGLHPKSAAIQLNLGIARYWAGEGDAKAAWQAAAELEPDTQYAVTAGNLLHPEFARNLPLFVPVANIPAAVRRLDPPEQFATLARRARNGSVTDRLFYGVALQRLGRQVSAERVFAEAARLHPTDPEARVAAAVGLFDKAAPVKAFSRLGPLSKTFPAGGDGSLPPRSPPALVGAGEGGPPAARARSDR